MTDGTHTYQVFDAVSYVDATAAHGFHRAEPAVPQPDPPAVPVETAPAPEYVPVAPIVYAEPDPVPAPVDTDPFPAPPIDEVH